MYLLFQLWLFSVALNIYTKNLKILFNIFNEKEAELDAEWNECLRWRWRFSSFAWDFICHFLIFFGLFVSPAAAPRRRGQTAGRTDRKWERGERKWGGGCWGTVHFFSLPFFFPSLFFWADVFLCLKHLAYSSRVWSRHYVPIHQSLWTPTHPPTLPPSSSDLPSHTHTHTFHSNWSPPHRPPPPPTEVNYQNCVWKWMKADCRSLSPFSLLTRPFPGFDISGFFFSRSLSRLLPLLPLLLFSFFPLLSPLLTRRRLWARW